MHKKYRPLYHRYRGRYRANCCLLGAAGSVSYTHLDVYKRQRYFQYNKDLLLDHRKAALQQELAAEQRRHGGM